jgi:hypothetical protein
MIQRIALDQPTLGELLNEPIVRLLMASDGVARSDVEALFKMSRRRKATAATAAAR